MVLRHFFVGWPSFWEAVSRKKNARVTVISNVEISKMVTSMFLKNSIGKKQDDGPTIGR